MNVKKMFASLTGVLMLASMATPLVTGAATYSDELQGAYEYAYSKGITTMSPIDNANMYGELTRGQLSKMISNWAESELGRTVDETAVCSFTDTNTAEGDLATYVVKACQMGLMGQGITAFRPNDKVTRGEFGTTLSRAIWGDKYDGANPYYANHLAALSQEGIMTKISEPNNLEIRGWVMLMLQRAATTVAPEECKDAAVVMACALDPESDACPAACRKPAKDDETTDTGKEEVVKSGDLSITATAATGRKAIANWVSDLDTVTLKTSEALTVNSITLERFGYSSADEVEAVWLEDAYGNKIADSKSLSTSKDTVTLKIKKEYREMEASNAVTVVVQLSWAKEGGTIGFKVTDVESSAKNVDIADYNPYTYDIVNYKGANVEVSVKGNDKDYNYEPKDFYEVSRIKVKAGSSAILVNGITLTNDGTISGAANVNVFDLDEFVSDVKVTVDWETVKGVKYNLTKDNELVLSFDDVEIGINKNAQFVVSIAMDSFDDFGYYARLVLKDTGDLKAVEKKTGARTTIDAPAYNDASWKLYKFNGSKVKLVNTKISSTIDAAQGSEDVVIAKGNITVGEEVKIPSLVLTADATGVIDWLTLYVAGEEYDAKVTNSNQTFTFSNVIIEKSGDVELRADIVDEDRVADKLVTITFGSTTSSTINKSAFDGARYEESRKNVDVADVAGSISISKVKVQPAKGSLEKSNSKDVEFLTNETSRKTIFEGTYTAKKNDVYLNKFSIYSSDGKLLSGNDEITFYLSIDGEEVGNIDMDKKDTATTLSGATEESFSQIKIEAGKSVKVKLDAEVYPDEANAGATHIYALVLNGEDVNGADAGRASEDTVKLKFVKKGSVTVSDNASASKNTVLLSSSNITLAKFTVKPSNNVEGLTLDELVLSGTVTSDTVSTTNWTWTPATPAAATAVTSGTTAVDGTDYYTRAESTAGTGALNDGSFKYTKDTTINSGTVIADNNHFTLSDLGTDGSCDVTWMTNETDCVNAIASSSTTTTTWAIDLSKLRVKVDWQEIDVWSDGITWDAESVEIPVNGIEVEVTLKGSADAGDYNLSLVSVNWKTMSRTYKKQVVNALVWVKEQENKGWAETKYTFGVDTANDETVSDVVLYYGDTFKTAASISGEFADWDTAEAANKKDGVEYITKISYKVDWKDMVILKSNYNDFFKVWDTYVKIFKAD